ncbi:hypothetical protein [Agrococcus sp. Marseille-Q4369]|nr:hypothetical protein [Agrococcus sp. Marseille-Q4369]
MSTISNRFARLVGRMREEERGDVPGWVLVTLVSSVNPPKLAAP